MRRSFFALLVVFTAQCELPARGFVWARVHPPAIERIVVDSDFPSAYQVELADVNGDKKLDIIAVGGGTCAWYENPTWRKRLVSDPRRTPGVISSATADLDHDGKAEIAIAYEFAMNAPAKGKLVLAVQGRGLDDPWKLNPIADLGSIHRLRWGDVDGDGRLELVVAPIFGPGARPPTYASPARLTVFTAADSSSHTAWKGKVVAQRNVMHAIEVIDADGDGRSDILTADNGGVLLVQAKSGELIELIPGSPGNAPKRGSSEVHLGRLADGRRFLATIDPWHGNEVAVCIAGDYQKYRGVDDRKALHFGPRSVLDGTLADGHALWIADVDRDGDDEVFAGHRGKDHRVSMYDFDRAKNTWSRSVLDRDIAAQDLRGGDLDGDGTPDLVAVGGATHNVVWYRPKRTGTGQADRAR
jgi:hypothetical protein